MTVSYIRVSLDLVYDSEYEDEVSYAADFIHELVQNLIDEQEIPTDIINSSWSHAKLVSTGETYYPASNSLGKTNDVVNTVIAEDTDEAIIEAEDMESVTNPF